MVADTASELEVHRRRKRPISHDPAPLKVEGQLTLQSLEMERWLPQTTQAMRKLRVPGRGNHRQIYERSMMAPAFGDVSFSLGVGEVGLAWYDPNRSKFGWHIIKRIS